MNLHFSLTNWNRFSSGLSGVDLHLVSVSQSMLLKTRPATWLYHYCTSRQGWFSQHDEQFWISAKCSTLWSHFIYISHYKFYFFFHHNESQGTSFPKGKFNYECSMWSSICFRESQTLNQRSVQVLTLWIRRYFWGGTSKCRSCCWCKSNVDFPINSQPLVSMVRHTWFISTPN